MKFNYPTLNETVLALLILVSALARLAQVVVLFLVARLSNICLIVGVQRTGGTRL